MPEKQEVNDSNKDNIIPLIENFILSYKRERDYYNECARIAASILEDRLRQEGIRAIVSYRAKNEDSLKKKLYSRNQKKPYKFIADIYADIPDFSGVRVATYFPNDIGVVEKILGNIFTVNMTKTYPESGNTDSGKKFSGYHAKHFRVCIGETHKGYDRYSSSQIEIQVASLMMHSWSEVEHDLVYKPQSGEISQEEKDILDQLNGLVLSGEIALSLLKKAMENRVTAQNKPFRDQYDLRNYIDSKVSNFTILPENGYRRIDLLFEVLKTLGKNTAGEINQIIDDYIKNIDEGIDPSDITDYIIDSLLNSGLYTDNKLQWIIKIYSNESEFTKNFGNSNLDSSDTWQVSYAYILLWGSLNKVVRQFAEHLIRNSKNKGNSSIELASSENILFQYKIFSEEELYKYQNFKKSRNYIVHFTDKTRKDVPDLLGLITFTENIIPKIKTESKSFDSLEEILREVRSLLSNDGI